MDPELDDAPELEDHYDIRDLGNCWHFTCLVCSRNFSARKGFSNNFTRYGLLRHARSHAPPAGEEADRG